MGKKNGTEESENEISIVVEAFLTTPYMHINLTTTNSPNIRASLATEIPIGPTLGDPALVSHATLSDIGYVSASHASFGHAIADLVGALDTGISSRRRFVFVTFIFIGLVAALLGRSATVAMSRMGQIELSASLKTETLSDPLLQLAIGRLVAPRSVLVVEIIAPPSSNVGTLLAGRGSVGAGGDAAKAIGLEDDAAAVLANVVARRGRRVLAISPSLDEAATGAEDGSGGEENEKRGDTVDHV